jgi:hypothetical protein
MGKQYGALRHYAGPANAMRVRIMRYEVGVVWMTSQHVR